MLKVFSGHGYLLSQHRVVGLCQLLVNLYIWRTILTCRDSIHLALALIGKHGCLSTLCYRWFFNCQPRMLKMFPGPGYLFSEKRVVWLTRTFTGKFLYMTHQFIFLRLNLFGMRSGRENGGLSTLCHRFGFACPQKVLTTFPGTGYCLSDDMLIWLWQLPVNLYIWVTISSCYFSILCLKGCFEGIRHEHSVW